MASIRLLICCLMHNDRKQKMKLGLPVLLLFISNIFMTFAWYGHLKSHRASPLIWVILISWSIAFFEYCFQVPANRLLKNCDMPVAYLKAIQEIITLLVFAIFSVTYLKEEFRWNYVVGFALLILAAFFIFWKPPAKIAPDLIPVVSSDKATDEPMPLSANK